MIVEAIDKRTGRTLRAEDAYSGQRLQCPYCGVDVHPVLGVETPFYRCYEGGEHTNCICKQLDRSNRVYDPQLTDASQLFDNLFHPVREKEELSWESDEDEGLVDPELEDEYLYGDESEYGTDADTDESEEEESKPAAEPVILPCRTLSQLWKAEIHEFKANDRVGTQLRSDIFLWYKDFNRFFVCRDDLWENIMLFSNAVTRKRFNSSASTRTVRNELSGTKRNVTVPNVAQKPIARRWQKHIMRS